jgi:predicted HicB family RNase H-like nuclease
MTLYKGYAGSLEVDAEAGIIFGRVSGLRDVITFQGETVAEAIQAFHDSVDDYLEFCEERGESPEKPYSGRFLLRMDPALHRHLAYMAEELKVSINTLVEDALEAHYGPVPPSLARNQELPQDGGPDIERAQRARDVLSAAVSRGQPEQESPG